jgi:hypothetical protein
MSVVGLHISPDMMECLSVVGVASRLALSKAENRTQSYPVVWPYKNREHKSIQWVGLIEILPVYKCTRCRWLGFTFRLQCSALVMLVVFLVVFLVVLVMLVMFVVLVLQEWHPSGGVLSEDE